MPTKLIIGIGNPGPEYENTRHNIGWIFLDFISKKAGAERFNEEKKLNAAVAKGRLELRGKSIPVILAKPLGFVNASGTVVVKLKNYFRVRPEDIIVVQDDLDIQFGACKLSFDKNSGGHRGIESIIKSLKTKKFYRLRMGTARPALDRARQQSDKKRDELVRDFVLSKFSKSEYEQIKTLFKQAWQRLEQM